MKVKVKNLGPLKQAEFSLGDMTIICGENNTGKTYATYALFGFLYLWQRVLSIRIGDNIIEHLLADGVVHFDVSRYDITEILSRGCRVYTGQLPMVFAAPQERFKNTEFQVLLGNTSIDAREFERRINTATDEILTINKDRGSNEMVVSLLTERKRVTIPRHVVKMYISEALRDMLVGHLLPRPFIASAERTGAAIFRKELNFARNRLLEEISQTDKNIDPMELLFKAYSDYAIPKKRDVDFTRQLRTTSKNKSFIAENNASILDDFADIIDGEYQVAKNDDPVYIPRGKGRRVRLSMDESSSAVRSLLDIGFYLKHVAQPGDLLMVDEPELNLHPENQCRVARLFARLVNLGIKVFITTHSDYIIKELNTLIMLNHDKPHLKRIAREEGYKQEELISAEEIKVYIAEVAPVLLEGKKNKTRCHTLVPADIDPDLGIEARSFDKTIDKMNSIQDEIVWGGE